MALLSMPVVTVPKDSTDSLLRVTLVDQDGDPETGLDAATGPLYFHAKTVDGVSVLQDGTATWTTDGSDAQIEFPLTANEVDTARDLLVEFEVQGLTSGDRVSRMFILRVLERARV